jgi:hypothetical protein
MQSLQFGGDIFTAFSVVFTNATVRSESRQAHRNVFGAPVCKWVVVRGRRRRGSAVRQGGCES